MTDTPESCPFCRAGADVIAPHGDHAICRICHARGPTGPEPLAQWNWRPSPWISVYKRPPTEEECKFENGGGQFLVTHTDEYGNPQKAVARYSTVACRWLGANWRTITHWAPMPGGPDPEVHPTLTMLADEMREREEGPSQ